jgi:ribosomal protein L3
VKVDEARNLVYLRGAVPGHNNGYLMISKTVKV